MAIERPSIQTIYLRIKADMELRLTQGNKIPRVSVLGILATVFAGAIHLCYGLITWLADQLFPDTATSAFLDRLSAIKGLTRKAASFATGSIKITGTNSTLVPSGTIFQDANGNQYETLENVIIISPFISANVQSILPGIESNTTDTQLTILNPLPDVDSIALVGDAISGGADLETDDSLRARLLFIYSQPPAGGRDSDYYLWATEIAGVDLAWVIGSYYGPSTVAVIIAKADGSQVDSSTLSSCQTNVDSKRPLGVLSTVVNIEPVTMNFNINISPVSADIETNIKDALKYVFLNQVTPGGTILISHIYSAISSSGVYDYEILEMSLTRGMITTILPLENVILNQLELPALGVTTFGAL